jgi:hypothetical protein
MTMSWTLAGFCAAFAVLALIMPAAEAAQAPPACRGIGNSCSSLKHVGLCHYERLHYPSKWVCNWSGMKTE